MSWYDMIMALPDPDERILEWEEDEHARCVALQMEFDSPSDALKVLSDAERQRLLGLRRAELNWRLGMGRAMRKEVEEAQCRRESTRSSE